MKVCFHLSVLVLLLGIFCVTKGTSQAAGQQCQSESFTLIAKQLQELKMKVNDMKSLLDKQSNVMHFQLPPNKVTWTRTQQFCKKFGWILCSRNQIFPIYGNVPFIIGVQPGDHWTPISDTYNDWVQVGDSRGWTGETHLEKHSSGVPPWGERITNAAYKGHVFCCTSE